MRRIIQSHKNWLIITSVVIGSFGPLIAMVAVDGGRAIVTWSREFLNGPGRDAENVNDGTTQFLSAVDIVTVEVTA